MSDDTSSSNSVGSVGAKFDMPGIEDAVTQLKALNTQFGELIGNLKNLSNNQGTYASGVRSVTEPLANLAQPTGVGYTPPPNYANNGGDGGGGDADSGLVSQIFGGASSGNYVGAAVSLATAPLTYAFNRVEQNRATTRNLSYDLSRVSTMSGTGIGGILGMLSNQTPVMGTPEAITETMTRGAAEGYFNMNDPKSGAYYTGLRQMQQLTPGTQAPELAGIMNASLNNTRAQQTSMLLTGGAMGNFGPGGVPKTLQEWAEGLLRWFEGQRPGANRGKPFTKQELASQVFPGSNMEAWMSTTGVSPEMQDYFWQYAMGKAQETGGTGGTVTMDQIISQRGGDLGLSTRVTETAQAKRDFTMASTTGNGPLASKDTFYNQYLTRETADTNWAAVMSRMVDAKIADLLGRFGDTIAKIPTPLASMAAGTVANLPSLLQNLTDTYASARGGVSGSGDPEFMIGDAGTYGPLGGTGTAGMTPGMASRVSAMMRANPNLQINSGFRDGALQGRLHANGVGMTAPAGKSMHGRGLAADLGPSSQYGWIAANASKFGLQSGNKAGEPWHVGFPGTVPGRNFMTGDPEAMIGDVSDVLNPSSWWEGIKSVGSSVFDFLGNAGSDLIGGIKNIGTSLFQGAQSLLKGDWTALLGGGSPFDPSQLSGNALSGLFNLMGVPALLNPLGTGSVSGASSTDFSTAFAGLLNSGKGGIIAPNLKSSMDWSNIAAAGGAGAAGAAGTAGAYAGAPSTAGSVQEILQKYGGGAAPSPASVAGHESAILAALNAAATAGFKGDELIAMGAIAGRESTWNPGVHFYNAGTKDDSYGEWQINFYGGLGPDRDKLLGTTPSSRDTLKDLQTNANAAFKIAGGGLGPWGGYKGVPALHGATQYVQPVYDIAKSAHLIGDPEFSQAYQPFGAPGGPQVTVRNTISITGGANQSPANLRQTASQLAAYTTAEIRKQMARTT